jgi:hypothetical protein
MYFTAEESSHIRFINYAVQPENSDMGIVGDTLLTVALLHLSGDALIVALCFLYGIEPDPWLRVRIRYIL